MPTTQNIKKQLPIRLTTTTLLFGILFLLAFIEYSHSGSYIKVQKSQDQRLYQTVTAQLTLLKDVSAHGANKASLNRMSLGAALVLHGLFTLLHCFTLVAIQKIESIELLPFLKTTLFAAFVSLGTSIGFVLSLAGLQGKDTQTRLLFGKITWVSSSFVWMQISYGYGSLFAHDKKLYGGWRNLMFYIGDYRMVPAVAYGVAGVFGLLAVTSAESMGHWSEPALVGCLIGDVAALHRTWLRMREPTDNDKSDTKKL
jgi:hypothetical protein